MFSLAIVAAMFSLFALASFGFAELLGHRLQFRQVLRPVGVMCRRQLRLFAEMWGDHVAGEHGQPIIRPPFAPRIAVVSVLPVEKLLIGEPRKQFVGVGEPQRPA